MLYVPHRLAWITCLVLNLIDSLTAFTNPSSGIIRHSCLEKEQEFTR